MVPFSAIFRKEVRQQGALAVAMVLLCLLLQLTCYLMTLFPEWSGGGFMAEYFAIAVFMTALYGGSAAAIVFSCEQEDRTFNFLRALPVSSSTVFWGKAAWLVSGTILVFAGTSLLTLFWNLLSVDSRAQIWSPGEVMGMFGIGIVEAFAWGLFWSPRCRSQVHALLATYFFASVIGYYVSVFTGGSNFSEIYYNAIPFRLGISAVVLAIGVWSGLRWFDLWVTKPSVYDPTGKPRRKLLDPLPYPSRIQTPFFALVHHTIRQSQTLFLVGISLACLCVACSLLYTLSARFSIWADTNRYLPIFLTLGSVLYCVILCGSIFGGDQKNESFRFLSRCGVSPGKVWWSRVLTVFVLTVPFVFALYFVLFGSTVRDRHEIDFGTWLIKMENEFVKKENLFYWIPSALAMWIIPFSCGALLSISIRRIIVSVALTGAASVGLICWMYLFLGFFGFSPIWTTGSVCLALLVLSRLRAADWLRERRTWKSRFKTFTPIFAVFLAVFIATPFIRIYSVPDVSLSEVEYWFEKAELPEKLSSEKRRELFADIASRIDKPLTKEEYAVFIQSPVVKWTNPYQIFLERYGKITKTDDKSLLLENLHQELEVYAESVENCPTFEEWTLREYEFQRRWILSKPGQALESKDTDWFLGLYRFMPWERTRTLRRLNSHLILSLVRVGNFAPSEGPDERMYFAERRIFEPHLFESPNMPTPMMDDVPWLYHYDVAYFGFTTRMRLHLVHTALHCWYLEHDETLPESLDELVEAEYLKAIPIDPRTGLAMEYQTEKDQNLIDETMKSVPRRNQWYYSNHKPGWPCLKFPGEQYKDLDFLSGFEEYKLW